MNRANDKGQLVQTKNRLFGFSVKHKIYFKNCIKLSAVLCLRGLPFTLVPKY